jgi:hypothetical protein
MTWFAFPGGWGDYNLNGPSEKTLALTGAHGYATQAEADAHVNASPDPPQVALLQTLKLYSVSPIGAGAFGDLKTPNSTGGVGGALANLTGNITGGLKWPSADTFLVRALKIIVGGVLLVAGIMKMTGTSKDDLKAVGKATAGMGAL